MLIGYVSDERYVALPDVLLEFEQDGESLEARSRATGAVVADLSPGEYAVTLYKAGYGSKRVRVAVTAKGAKSLSVRGSDEVQEFYQFRLLSDGLLGYVWPKWLKSGERSEFRVHAVEQYKLSLWRYGYEKEFVRNIGWFDEHGPGATMQITPDGDYTRTGVQRAKYREKLQEISKETETKTLDVLTKEQKAQFEKMKGEKFEFRRFRLGDSAYKPCRFKQFPSARRK